jgi:hypothetical protein
VGARESGDVLIGHYLDFEDVIFANTFFALEETGLSYPSLLPDATDADSDASRTGFRSIADRVPTHRRQRSDDRGQLWMSG